MPNLTDSQRQHIVDLLAQGRDLPLDYKHLLFPPERQKYELVYAGKEREEDILVDHKPECDFVRQLLKPENQWVNFCTTL